MKKEVMIAEGYIEYCPDVGGSCVGPACAAFAHGIDFGTNDVTPLVAQIGYEMKVRVPLMFHLDVYHCLKYGRLIGKDSAGLYFSFLEELDVLRPGVSLEEAVEGCPCDTDGNDEDFDE